MQLLALLIGSMLGALIAATGWLAFGFTLSTALTVYFVCALLPAVLSLLVSAMQTQSQDTSETAPVTR